MSDLRLRGTQQRPWSSARITPENLEPAARAAGITTEKAVTNLLRTFSQRNRQAA